jgi:undecaprenyl-diphosphatase
LVLGGYVVGLREPHLFFDIILHVATLVATVYFYRHTLLQMGREAASGGRALVSRQQSLQMVVARNPNVRLLLLVCVGVVPTGLIGVLFKDPLEALFGEPRNAAAMLLVTAFMLTITRWTKPSGMSLPQMKAWHAVVIGLVQGMAIVPGISRSGSTIACALLLGLDRELAARYSFVLSLPAIAGALLLKLLDGAELGAIAPVALVVGFFVAALSGIIALRILIPMVKHGRFYFFAFYLVPAGVLGLWFIPG